MNSDGRESLEPWNRDEIERPTLAASS